MSSRCFSFLIFAAGTGIPVAVAAEAARPAPASATNAAPAAASSSIAPAAAYDGFRVIGERNIFNPNRTGRRERTTEETAPRVDVLSLVGTMDSDRGLRAFFDGSDGAFRKALRTGDAVEKFKVAQITPNVVTLERDGKRVTMHVGQQMRRSEGADWTLVGEDVAQREAQARVANENRVDPAAPPTIPANADDLTRRMMERRAKQLKQ